MIRREPKVNSLVPNAKRCTRTPYFQIGRFHHFVRYLLVVSHQYSWDPSRIVYNLQLLPPPSFQLDLAKSLLVLEAVTILSMDAG